MSRDGRHENAGADALDPGSRLPPSPRLRLRTSDFKLQTSNLHFVLRALRESCRGELPAVHRQRDVCEYDAEGHQGRDERPIARKRDEKKQGRKRIPPEQRETCGGESKQRAARIASCTSNG